jgi:hypothetical protein
MESHSSKAGEELPKLTKQHFSRVSLLSSMQAAQGHLLGSIDNPSAPLYMKKPSDASVIWGILWLATWPIFGDHVTHASRPDTVHVRDSAVSIPSGTDSDTPAGEPRGHGHPLRHRVVVETNPSYLDFGHFQALATAGAGVAQIISAGHGKLTTCSYLGADSASARNGKPKNGQSPVL